ncbi:hypothetical protein GCM10020220_045560 [Nonomuraea rubra]
MHVTTVRYRVRRIEELTAGTCPRMADRVDFFLRYSVDTARHAEAPVSRE